MAKHFNAAKTNCGRVKMGYGCLRNIRLVSLLIFIFGNGFLATDLSKCISKNVIKSVLAIHSP